MDLWPISGVAFKHLKVFTVLCIGSRLFKIEAQIRCILSHEAQLETNLSLLSIGHTVSKLSSLWPAFLYSHCLFILLDKLVNCWLNTISPYPLRLSH